MENNLYLLEKKEKKRKSRFSDTPDTTNTTNTNTIVGNVINRNKFIK